MKTPSKTTRETLKTIAIAVLVTGVIAFVAGMKYQAHVNGQVKQEAKAMVSLQAKSLKQ